MSGQEGEPRSTRPLSLIRDLLLDLYATETPQNSQDLWRRHQKGRIPVVLPQTMEGVLRNLISRGIVESDPNNPQLVLMTKRGRAVTEEVVLATFRGFGDLEGAYDSKTGISVKSIIPSLLEEEDQTGLIPQEERLDATFARVTWRRPTPIHGFNKITEIFFFQSSGRIVLDGKERWVNRGNVVVLPPGRTIKLIPQQEGSLSAILLTRPRFDPDDMFIVDKK